MPTDLQLLYRCCPHACRANTWVRAFVSMQTHWMDKLDLSSNSPKMMKQSRLSKQHFYLNRHWFLHCQGYIFLLLLTRVVEPMVMVWKINNKGEHVILCLESSEEGFCFLWFFCMYLNHLSSLELLDVGGLASVADQLATLHFNNTLRRQHIKQRLKYIRCPLRRQKRLTYTSLWQKYLFLPLLQGHNYHKMHIKISWTSPSCRIRTNQKDRPWLFCRPWW